MYGYLLIGFGIILLALAVWLHRRAGLIAQREAEEHKRFLIETYGRECYRRATNDSPQANLPEPLTLTRKEVAS